MTRAFSATAWTWNQRRPSGATYDSAIPAAHRTRSSFATMSAYDCRIWL